MQSNVQLLEDVPPGRQCTVVSHLPGGKKILHYETLQKSRKLWSGVGKVSLSMWYTVTVVVHLAVCGLQMTLRFEYLVSSI